MEAPAEILDRDRPRNACLPDLVATQAAERPEAPALAAGEQVVSYGALDRRANQLAQRLRAVGVERGVLVGLCLPRSPEFVIGALGILKAGGAYVPLDPTYPIDRLSFMLDDAGVAVLVSHGALIERLPQGPWHVVALDNEPPDGGGEPAEAPEGAAKANDLAYVIYTSGSTGRPKGVQIEHSSLLNLIRWHHQAFVVSAGDRASHLATTAFDAAGWELWPYLAAGASVHIPDEATRVDPERLRDWLVAQRITICFLPTTMAERAIELAWPPAVALRCMLTGGDTLHRSPPPSLPFALINNYGPTECTVVATSGPVLAGGLPALLPPIGRPIANTQVHLLDERLRPVAAGVAGELYIGGAGLARGYLGRPDLTAERFVPDPFDGRPGTRLYRTGDLARYGANGHLVFLGRIDHQVKIREHRVELDEVAAVLASHPAVQSGVVVCREAGPGEKRVVAYVVPAAGMAATAAALRAFLATQLPDYMLPAAFVWLEELPLTPNGKVDRAALPTPDAVDGLGVCDDESPRTPLQERLAAIVAGLLGLPGVGLHDNFFMLGGHSLLGTQVIARVRETFGVGLPLHGLFDAPTVAELAVEVERRIVANLEAMTDQEAERLLT